MVPSVPWVSSAQISASTVVDLPAGLGLLKRLDRVVESADAMVMAALDESALRALIQSLNRLRAEMPTD